MQNENAAQKMAGMVRKSELNTIEKSKQTKMKLPL